MRGTPENIGACVLHNSGAESGALSAVSASLYRQLLATNPASLLCARKRRSVSSKTGSEADPDRASHRASSPWLLALPSPGKTAAASAYERTFAEPRPTTACRRL